MMRNSGQDQHLTTGEIVMGLDLVSGHIC
jgi:hypothetical protein